MNAITPEVVERDKQALENYKNKLKKERKMKIIVGITVVLGLAIFVWVRNVLADNQLAGKTIEQMNQELTVIEEKLMVNSQIYNDSQAIIESEKAKQEKATTENKVLREQKAKLIADKEAKLLGK